MTLTTAREIACLAGAVLLLLAEAGCVRVSHVHIHEGGVMRVEETAGVEAMVAGVARGLWGEKK